MRLWVELAAERLYDHKFLPVQHVQYVFVIVDLSLAELMQRQSHSLVSQSSSVFTLCMLNPECMTTTVRFHADHAACSVVAARIRRITPPLSSGML